jgi:hypothetical protein
VREGAQNVGHYVGQEAEDVLAEGLHEYRVTPEIERVKVDNGLQGVAGWDQNFRSGPRGIRIFLLLDIQRIILCSLLLEFAWCHFCLR